MGIRVHQFGDTNNGVMVTIGSLDLYFSYATLVAYTDPEDGKVVSENHWSQTTGKHLNYVDGGNKKDRLPAQKFDAKVGAMLKRHGLDKY